MGKKRAKQRLAKPSDVSCVPRHRTGGEPGPEAQSSASSSAAASTRQSRDSWQAASPARTLRIAVDSLGVFNEDGKAAISSAVWEVLMHGVEMYAEWDHKVFKRPDALQLATLDLVQCFIDVDLPPLTAQSIYTIDVLLATLLDLLDRLKERSIPCVWTMVQQSQLVSKFIAAMTDAAAKLRTEVAAESSSRPGARDWLPGLLVYSLALLNCHEVVPFILPEAIEGCDDYHTSLVSVTVAVAELATTTLHAATACAARCESPQHIARWQGYQSFMSYPWTLAGKRFTNTAGRCNVLYRSMVSTMRVAPIVALVLDSKLLGSSTGAPAVRHLLLLHLARLLWQQHDQEADTATHTLGSEQQDSCSGADSQSSSRSSSRKTACPAGTTVQSPSEPLSSTQTKRQQHTSSNSSSNSSTGRAGASTALSPSGAARRHLQQFHQAMMQSFGGLPEDCWHKACKEVSAAMNVVPGTGVGATIGVLKRQLQCIATHDQGPKDGSSALGLGDTTLGDMLPLLVLLLLDIARNKHTADSSSSGSIATTAAEQKEEAAAPAEAEAGEAETVAKAPEAVAAVKAADAAATEAEAVATAPKAAAVPADVAEAAGAESDTTVAAEAESEATDAAEAELDAAAAVCAAAAAADAWLSCVTRHKCLGQLDMAGTQLQQASDVLQLVSSSMQQVVDTVAPSCSAHDSSSTLRLIEQLLHVARCGQQVSSCLSACVPGHDISATVAHIRPALAAAEQYVRLAASAAKRSGLNLQLETYKLIAETAHFSAALSSMGVSAADLTTISQQHMALLLTSLKLCTSDLAAKQRDPGIRHLALLDSISSQYLQRPGMQQLSAAAPWLLLKARILAAECKHVASVLRSMQGPADQSPQAAAAAARSSNDGTGCEADGQAVLAPEDVWVTCQDTVVGMRDSLQGLIDLVRDMTAAATSDVQQQGDQDRVPQRQQQQQGVMNVCKCSAVPGTPSQWVQQQELLLQDWAEQWQPTSTVMSELLSSSQHLRLQPYQKLKWIQCSSDGCSIFEQLAAASHQLCALLPSPLCCNNPSCSNLSGLSEMRLVGGKSCVCAGCEAARYCGRECQAAHWPAHKWFCKMIRQSKAEAATAAK